MKKIKYRIRIETQRNGEKRYYAQRSTFYGLFNWECLDSDGRPFYEISFSLINNAENAINANKKLWDKEYQEEIIKMEYKYIE